jgi:hypothetical protein
MGRLAKVRFAPEAVIRAWPSSIIGGRGEFAKTRADYEPSHETQSRHRRAFYARGRTRCTIILTTIAYDNATITARLQLTIFGKWRAIPNKTSNSYIIEITSADR